MVTKCPTHHVITALSPSMYPSLFFAFIFSAAANSLATLGFSVINSAFKKLPLSKSFTIYYNITIENMI